MRYLHLRVVWLQLCQLGWSVVLICITDNWSCHNCTLSSKHCHIQRAPLVTVSIAQDHVTCNQCLLHTQTYLHDNSSTHAGSTRNKARNCQGAHSNAIGPHTRHHTHVAGMELLPTSEQSGHLKPCPWDMLNLGLVGMASMLLPRQLLQQQSLLQRRCSRHCLLTHCMCYCCRASF